MERIIVSEDIKNKAKVVMNKIMEEYPKLTEIGPFMCYHKDRDFNEYEYIHTPNTLDLYELACNSVPLETHTVHGIFYNDEVAFGGPSWLIEVMEDMTGETIYVNILDC